MAAPMLAIHEKKQVSIDLHRSLSQYIDIQCSETVKQMENGVEKASDLQKQYKDLCVMEQRFLISSEKERGHPYDASKQNKKAAQQNIHLKAVVVFKLAAIESQIALSADRTTAKGLEKACNAFQAASRAFALVRDNISMKDSVGQSTLDVSVECSGMFTRLKLAAARSFALLRDNISMKASIGQSTVDVSVECAGMLERLMLAQAQECFFEKVISNGKPNFLCAKVAWQVSLSYEKAYGVLKLPAVNQHFDPPWIAHVQLKAAQFYAESCYRSSLDLHEKEEIAEEIAYLEDGLTTLTAAKKSAKGVGGPLLDMVSKLEVNINRNLERATKENDRPPDSSAKAEKLQQESKITRVKVEDMDLCDSLLALAGNSTLREQLKGAIKEVQVDGGPAGLDSEMQPKRKLRREGQEFQVQAEELLQKEERENAQFKDQWMREQHYKSMMKFRGQLDEFAAKLKQFSEIAEGIERLIRDNYDKMSILDYKPAQNDAFAKVFNLEDYKAAIVKYWEIRHNINKSSKCYIELQDKFTKLKQRCSDFATKCNNWRSEMQPLVNFRHSPRRQLTQGQRQYGQQTVGPPAPFRRLLEKPAPQYFTPQLCSDISCWKQLPGP